MIHMDIARALATLNLTGNFSAEDILQSYRKKLFDIHPDTSRQADSDLTIDDLIASRRLLEEYLIEKKKPGTVSSVRKPDDDDGYRYYREGMRILGQALDSYWKKRVHYSQRPDKAEFLNQFHSELNRARDSFIHVLNHYPGGLWTPDAVEEIARINGWLGTEDNAR